MKRESPEDQTARFVSQIICEAGAAIMRIYQSDFSVEIKPDQSPLTLADKRSHEILTDHLKRRSPFPVLSEEGQDIAYDERKSWDQFWLIDPLDGTKEFLKRNGEFTVNVALMQGTAPILGAVYLPAKDILYYGIKGKGAYKNDRIRNIRLPLSASPRCLTVVGSRSHPTREFEDYVRALERKHGSVDIVAAGSSLKFCLVAEGTAHLYPRFGPTMEWDTAAAQIIVEEAGGHVINADSSGSLAYNKPSLVNPHFIAIGNSKFQKKIL